MDKDEDQNFSARIGETCGDDNNNEGTMVDYMHHQHQISNNSYFDKLSFADVMQFADFGPKLALNQTKINNLCEDDQETGMIDPVYFLKFPVLNDTEDDLMTHDDDDPDDGAHNKENTNNEEDRDPMVQLRTFMREDHENKNPMNMNIIGGGGKNKRKRPRSIKTSEEVESQRMTHIAVERNRRKQMNEHLRVLRSLMPGSYVQRGDQASIIGGAIEFVRELEQLLQCLESQKRRRLYGEAPPVRPQVGDGSVAMEQPPLFPPLETTGSLIQEETAENKSCFADVEVKVLGFDAIIKILCRRRPGQLVNTIAALEDLQLNILHTNITTIQQTVLYSFNVKVGNEMRFTAEDIASSVQQIFSFIHANTNL